MKNPYFNLNHNPRGWTRKAGLRLWLAFGVFSVAGLLLSSASAAPGSWSQRADIPEATSTPASCVLDGIFYVMGGHTNRYITNALPSVWAYDPQSDRWSSRAPLPAGRHFLGQCAVPLNGRIYLVGGSGDGKPGPLITEVGIYDPQTDTWSSGAAMPTGRGNLAACAVDGIIYAIAGALDTSRRTAAMEAYDTASNQWSVKTPMPQARWFVTASVVNGIIYVFHGNDLFIYDPKTDRWRTSSNHFYPYSWGLMSAEVGGTIYLFGGMTEDWTDGNSFTLAYDPATDQFTPRRKMPHKRITSGCGVIDGKIYLVAGANKELAVNSDAILYTSMEVFDPQGGVTPHIRSGSFANPNAFHLAWQGEPGISYGVQSSVNLATSWARIGPAITATNAIVETTVTVPTGEAKRFFRVFEVTD